MEEYINALVSSIVASIISYYICKWLDSKIHK